MKSANGDVWRPIVNYNSMHIHKARKITHARTKPLFDHVMRRKTLENEAGAEKTDT